VDREHESGDLRELFQIYHGECGFGGCSRPDFLDELAKLIPDEIVEFLKNLVSVVDQAIEEQVVMRFSDEGIVTADMSR